MMVLHMPTSTVHLHRLNTLTRSVTLHVSRVHLWLMLRFVLVARPLPENGSPVTPRHDLGTTNVSVSCGEEKRVCHQPWTSVQAHQETRTGGERLTLLYASTTTLNYIQWLHIYLYHSKYKDSPFSRTPTPTTPQPRHATPRHTTRHHTTPHHATTPHHIPHSTQNAPHTTQYCTCCLCVVYVSLVFVRDRCKLAGRGSVKVLTSSISAHQVVCVVSSRIFVCFHLDVRDRA